MEYHLKTLPGEKLTIPDKYHSDAQKAVGIITKLKDISSISFNENPWLTDRDVMCAAQQLANNPDSVRYQEALHLQIIGYYQRMQPVSTRNTPADELTRMLSQYIRRVDCLR